MRDGEGLAGPDKNSDRDGSEGREFRQKRKPNNYHGATGSWMSTPPPPSPFEQAVIDKFEAAKALLLSKHRDYGPKNISDSPGGPINGLRVRIHDKVARINNLIDGGWSKFPQHEPMRDSFIDLANYAIIALLVLDGEWDLPEDNKEVLW